MNVLSDFLLRVEKALTIAPELSGTIIAQKSGSKKTAEPTKRDKTKIKSKPKAGTVVKPEKRTKPKTKPKTGK
jgi:hypothetical protein